MPLPLVLELVAPDSPTGGRVLRDYLQDVARRWYGRPATAAEVDQALADDSNDDLVPPHGLLLVARTGGDVVGCAGGDVVGCAGLRLLPDGIGEVKRVFVAAEARGCGIGAALLRELEHWYAERLVQRTP